MLQKQNKNKKKKKTFGKCLNCTLDSNLHTYWFPFTLRYFQLTIIFVTQQNSVWETNRIYIFIMKEWGSAGHKIGCTYLYAIIKTYEDISLRLHFDPRINIPKLDRHYWKSNSCNIYLRLLQRIKLKTVQ